ncbi:hypothetical protein VTI74DRAFT_10057 [Chaetomium olivicolor]
MAPLFDSPPPTPSSNSFSQPRPRPPRSPRHLAQIRVQNRRREYLERHREYFQSADHELADPLLYDFLIRRFQTPAEREAEGKAKGYARVLEGSLLRGEERMAKLREQTIEKNAAAPSGSSTSPTAVSQSNGGGGGGGRADKEEDVGTSFSSLNAELSPPPKTKQEGRAQWEEFLRDRFIRGEDDDFDYAVVDEDDEYDALEREEREEAWFEDEDPGWASEESDGGGKAEKVLHGETGIQDF